MLIFIKVICIDYLTNLRTLIKITNLSGGMSKGHFLKGDQVTHKYNLKQELQVGKSFGTATLLDRLDTHLLSIALA